MAEQDYCYNRIYPVKKARHLSVDDYQISNALNVDLILFIRSVAYFKKLKG